MLNKSVSVGMRGNTLLQSKGIYDKQFRVSHNTSNQFNRIGSNQQTMRSQNMAAGNMSVDMGIYVGE